MVASAPFYLPMNPHEAMASSSTGKPFFNVESTKLHEDPSPTDSIGEFGTVPPVNSNFLEDVREGVRSSADREPRGFGYEDNVCYRNAVILMLLCNDRFMGYVQNHHLDKIEISKAPNDEESETKQNKSPRASDGRKPGTRGRSGSKLRSTRTRSAGRKRRAASITRSRTANTDNLLAEDYTDMLLELQKLWTVYWGNGDQDSLEKAMKRLWRYLKGVDTHFTWDGPAFAGQQDAAGYLSWFIQSLRGHFEQMPILNNEKIYLNDLVKIGVGLRKRCARCDEKRNVKIKMSQSFASCDDVWRIGFGESKPKGKDRGKAVPLSDLLQQWTKELAEEFFCEDCQKGREKWLRGLPEKEKKKYSARMLDKQWESLRRLPELLFMQLTRFDLTDPLNPRKDNTLVDLPEELDLRNLLDKTVPAEERELTRYRLVGVLMHAGKLAKGHYINYTRMKDGQWWLIDGVGVAAVDFDHINTPRFEGATRSGKGGAPWTPYLLCWEKIFDESPLPEAESIKQPTSPTTLRSPPKSSQSLRRRSGGSDGGKLAVRFQETEAVTTSVERQSPEIATVEGVLRVFLKLDGKRYFFQDITLAVPADLTERVDLQQGPTVQVGVKLYVPGHDQQGEVGYDLVNASHAQDGLAAGVLTNSDLLRTPRRMHDEARPTTPADSLQENDQQQANRPGAAKQMSPGGKRKHSEVVHEAIDEGQSDAPPQKRPKLQAETSKRTSNSRSASPAVPVSDEDRIRALADSGAVLNTKTPDGYAAFLLRTRRTARDLNFERLVTKAKAAQAAATPQSAKVKAKFDKDGKPRVSTTSPAYRDTGFLTSFLKSIPPSSAKQTTTAETKEVKTPSVIPTAAPDKPERKRRRPSRWEQTKTRQSSLPPNLGVAGPSPAKAPKSQANKSTAPTASNTAPKSQAAPAAGRTTRSNTQKNGSDSRKTPSPPVAPPSPLKSSSPYEEEWSPGKEAEIAAAVKAAKEKRIANERATLRGKADREQTEAEAAEAAKKGKKDTGKKSGGTRQQKDSESEEEEEEKQAKPKPRGRAAAKARGKTDGGKGKAAAKPKPKLATKPATTTKSTTTTRPAAKQAVKTKRDDNDDDDESSDDDHQKAKRARTKANAKGKGIVRASTKTAAKATAKASTTTTTSTRKPRKKPVKQTRTETESESESSSQSEAEGAEDVTEEDEDSEDGRDAVEVQPSPRATARARGTQRKKPSRAQVSRFFFR